MADSGIVETEILHNKSDQNECVMSDVTAGEIPDDSIPETMSCPPAVEMPDDLQAPDSLNPETAGMVENLTCVQSALLNSMHAHEPEHAFDSDPGKTPYDESSFPQKDVTERAETSESATYREQLIPEISDDVQFEGGTTYADVAVENLMGTGDIAQTVLAPEDDVSISSVLFEMDPSSRITNLQELPEADEGTAAMQLSTADVSNPADQSLEAGEESLMMYDSSYLQSSKTNLSDAGASIEKPVIPVLEGYEDQEDSQSSFSSQKSRRSAKPVDEDSVLSVGHATFPVEKLFEYQWPRTKSGERYFLQEQISEYLAVKSFKRKPRLDTTRGGHTGEKISAGAWRSNGVGVRPWNLRARRQREIARSDGQKDYPLKYLEYTKVLADREREKINNRNKEYGAARADQEKLKAYIRKAMRSAAEFNVLFNKERREERQAYFDLQTQRIQYPANKMLKVDKATTGPSAYPVALIPGQFQNYYKRYTPEELRYLPVNTVLYGPPRPAQSFVGEAQSGGHGLQLRDSDSDSASATDSSSDSGSDSSSSSEGEAEKQEEYTSPKPPKPLVGPIVAGYQPKVKPDAKCGVCLKGSESNKHNRPESPLHCSQCDNSGHPTCLELTDEMVPIIKNYPWQCMDCKTCMCCLDPYDEDKMMFCDMCDRGYHTFCVGLRNIPTGRWVCEDCGMCTQCGTRRPGSISAQWVHEYTRQRGGAPPKFLQTLCVDCSNAKKAADSKSSCFKQQQVGKLKRKR
ncbi:PREDICTED: LOW QUALITY PROTEIN: PHD finger protein 10-like [Priapulus caudatus]|uniref:PHD finger protein 10 n=1 Tax=Priapulus caudatus TaxID=37621 RepID=A0ABM1DPJ8_PRICU|nr:PREDICTED: LOW QUALITY PROTEIN: PHD finger protein 10-like [Priapulus caudatus]